MLLGFNTLGRLATSLPATDPQAVADRLGEIVDQAVLAEELGFDAFSIGEHHGDLSFVTSAPPVILAAIAARTSRIRLMTGVTLLPLLDPVRVAEDYATLDQLSGGRAEIVAGKGNFQAASRLLVGEDQPDRAAMLRERLPLLLSLLEGHVDEWDGEYRPPLRDSVVSPPPLQARLPIWLGATRSLDALDLAAEHGLGAFIAGFRPGSYADFADHYRERFSAHGRDPAKARIASLTVTSVEGHAEAARRRFRDYWEHTASLASSEPRFRRLPGLSFEEMTGPDGQVVIGTPQTLAERIVAEHDALGHDVHLIQVDAGRSHAEICEAMEVIAAEVAPAVRRATGTAVVAG